MALAGKAFLAMWMDMAPEFEDQWEARHIGEHMPERVDLPGFTAARRYENNDSSVHRYFILYEGAGLKAFSSVEYLAALNEPKSSSSHATRNFIRGACPAILSQGAGMGGAIATFRFSPTGEDGWDNSDTVHAAANRLLALAGVTAVHLGIADSSVTQIRTTESQMRSSGNDEIFNAVLLVEGTTVHRLEAAKARIAEELRGAIGISGEVDADLYHLSYLLQDS